jgi:precorrin-6B methylase 2
VPVSAEDVFVDLGAGLGKVAMAVHLLSGARTRGVELQPELVERARTRAADLGLEGVSLEHADARTADLSDATVIFLYLAFTGATLATVMRRLEAVAQRRALVVCALGVDLRAYPWLRARETQDFWLSVYDSQCPGAAPRPLREAASLGRAADDVASERASA